MAGATLVQVDRLGRLFGRHEVVRSLSFAVAAGERAALLGPNGSGKTTVLRCVAGTVTPTRGEVVVAGKRGGSLGARRVVGTSFSQERSFYLRLTGRQNLLFFARLRLPSRAAAARAVRSLEEELQLEEILEERVDRCSTGMTQQLAFARALLSDPPVLLLDEPTRSLDEVAAARLWGALDRRRERTALLIATHRPDDVARCEQRIELPR